MIEFDDALIETAETCTSVKSCLYFQLYPLMSIKSAFLKFYSIQNFVQIQ